MWVNGDYRRGISVMDRHQARAQETLKIAQALQTWVNQLQPSGAVYTKPAIPSGFLLGLTGPPAAPWGIGCRRLREDLALSDHYPHLLERLSRGRRRPDGSPRKGLDGHAGQRPERACRGPEGHSFLRPLSFLRRPCFPAQGKGHSPGHHRVPLDQVGTLF